MTTRKWRLVGFQLDPDSVKSVQSIHEITGTKTLDGTYRKIGRIVCEMFSEEDVDEIIIDELIDASDDPTQNLEKDEAKETGEPDIHQP